MECKPNPVYKVGQRNYECPHYDCCVDHGLKNQWQYWTCSHCASRLQGTGVSLVRSVRHGESHPVEHYPN